ncbi:hypothetical protein, partial [Clostridium botulinum]
MEDLKELLKDSRIVKFRNEDVGIIIGQTIWEMADKIKLKYFDENLKWNLSGDDKDIMAIYEYRDDDNMIGLCDLTTCNLEEIIEHYNPKIIWERDNLQEGYEYNCVKEYINQGIECYNQAKENGLRISNTLDLTEDDGAKIVLLGDNIFSVKLNDSELDFEVSSYIY